MLLTMIVMWVLEDKKIIKFDTPVWVFAWVLLAIGVLNVINDVVKGL